MPRVRDPARFSRLVSVATDVFIERGYRRTQMKDVADAMGVAKGTIYLYVESKEALFDLAVRAANDDLAEPKKLPVATPKPGVTIRYVKDALANEARLPKLEAALGRPCPTDVCAELEGIVRELYALMHQRRVALKLIDRNAAQYPELAAIYFAIARQAIPKLLETYLDARLPRDRRDGVPLTAIARGVVEVIAFWAIHRHWDPAPTPVQEEASEAAAVRFALGALGR
ncbi:MAG: TetR/AcrR family transcriptional regulator [Myxococcales bacterium]|nr:TetR/AcrR family transcriptional regulator [Myxococcales bacterium]MDH3845500.1 TetR/AcrR family transcriptional regulator [Myxococcales bacterium]